MTNTDTIVVNNSSSAEALHSFFYIGEIVSDSGRSPGFTNEPGSSDEIEFEINFGPGGKLGIQNLPDEVVDIALGGNQINLNQLRDRRSRCRRNHHRAGPAHTDLSQRRR